MSTGGRYNNEPPETFACGHLRAKGNIAFNGTHPACLLCRRAYMSVYNRAYKQRAKEVALLAATKTKPHLHPTSPNQPIRK